jgi:hypothetical protein
VADAVDGGVALGVVPAVALGLLDRQRDPERSGGAERRRAPHREAADGVDQAVDLGEPEMPDLVRQRRLVDDDHRAVAPIDRAHARDCRCVPRRTTARPQDAQRPVLRNRSCVTRSPGRGAAHDRP